MNFIFLATPAFADAPKRIVSLAPNLTEILYSLGLEDRIVGVTTFCDFPRQARTAPKVGGMSNPSLEAIVRLKPDLVVITTDGNPRWVRDRLSDLGIRTYVFTAKRMSDLPDAVRGLGAAAGATDGGSRLASAIESAIAGVSTRSAAAAQKRRALFVVWPDPLIVAGAGTVVDDALTLLGWQNAAHDSLAAYPKFSLEEVIRKAPDVLVIGRGHEDMAKISRGLVERVKGGGKTPRVVFVSDALYRLGPRVAEGVEELQRALERPTP